MTVELGYLVTTCAFLLLGAAAVILTVQYHPLREERGSGGGASAQDFPAARPWSLFPAGALRGRCAGFTVPELMTTLTVLGVVTAVSVPSLSGVMLDARVKTVAMDVYNTMVYARSEAIKRNATVDIVPTGGNWKNGWTVQAGGTVLKTVGPATNGMDDMVSPSTISFRGDGRLTMPGTVTCVLNVSSNPEVTARRVIVDMSGRPSIRQGLS